MSTDAAFIEHILDQAGLGPRLRARKMFGEYGFHLDGVFVAMACDNRFFIKETPALADHGLDLPKGLPYPGANPYPLADELLDAPELLQTILCAGLDYLPPPKKR